MKNHRIMGRMTSFNKSNHTVSIHGACASSISTYTVWSNKVKFRVQKCKYKKSIDYFTNPDQTSLMKAGGAIILLLLYFLFFIILMYVMICGNSNRHRGDIIGKIYDFITYQLPTVCCNYCLFCVPAKYRKEVKKEYEGEQGIFKYIVAVFFAIIYVFFAAVYLIVCEPDSNIFFKNSTKYSYILLVFPVLFALITHFADPGEVTKDNYKAYIEKYPYDGVIYKEHVCKTLGVTAPARSRYCRYSNRRIAKYDHYCPWVLAPIGERTQRWFLLFLISTTITSGFYTFSYYKYLSWKYLIYKGQLKFTGTKTDDILSAIIFLIQQEPITFITCFALLVVFIVVLIFTLKTIKSISENILEVEKPKYEQQRLIREHYRNYDPVINVYDKGFFENWIECLFPRRPHSGKEKNE